MVGIGRVVKVSEMRRPNGRTEGVMKVTEG